MATNIKASGQTNRFRRVGEYSQDQLLKDLRDLNAEVYQLIHGVNSGDLGAEQGPRGFTGQKGERGSAGAAGPQGRPGRDGIDGVFDPTSVLLLRQYGFDGFFDDFLRALEWARIESAKPPRSRYDFGLLPVDAGFIAEAPLATVDFGMIA